MSLSEDVDIKEFLGSLEGDIETLFGTLFALLDDLENNVVVKMASLIGEFTVDEVPMDTDCESAFKPLIVKAAEKLQDLKKCLRQILAALQDLIENVQKDWKLDHEQLLRVNGC